MSLKAVARAGAGGSPATFTVVTATSKFLAADGAVGAPSYAFTAQPGTGFYRPSTFLIGVAFNGVQSFALDGNNASLRPGTNGLTRLGMASLGWGQLYLDYTNTGTVGNVTINKASGRVNLAAAGTTLTLTNSLITAASRVFLNADGAPGNVVAVQLYAVAAAGSCTINAVPAVTNQTAIDFLVINAD